MEKYLTSNLVMENAFIDKLVNNETKKTKTYYEKNVGDVKICTLNIKDKEAELKYNSKLGTHITAFVPELWKLEKSDLDRISGHLSKELRELLKDSLRVQDLNGERVLVAGLGNINITPDSLGPLTVQKICVTRHLELMNRRLFENEGICSVCALNCGVMGETGLRSLEVIKGISKEIEASVIIAVDALAARECDNIGSVVQISNSGISPGAGIGNRQYPINKDTLGIPVIAVGVPTVVSAASIIEETLKEFNDKSLRNEICKVLERRKNFFVSLKECDIIVDNSAELISLIINKAVGVI